MKTLIIYYSFTGNNRFLAERLQQHLNCDIFEIHEQKERKTHTILLDLIFRRKSKLTSDEPDWQRYQQIIFIAPIWDKGIAAPMKTFLMSEREYFDNFSFLTVCTGRTRQNDKLSKQLFQYTGKQPQYVYELEVNDLLPEYQKGKVKYTTPYRISDKDFEVFGDKFDEFTTLIKSEV